MKGMANREVCNINIRDYKTKQPYMYYTYGNTTDLSITSDSVYAMAHGTRKIAFQNPLESQITITFQVAPMKLYALYSDGIIDNTADYYVHSTVKCATAGEIPLTVSDGTIVSGSVFVYAEGAYGGTAIEGTYASNKFTATTASDLVVDNTYEVGFMVSRTNGVQKITLNNKRIPKDVAIDMDTWYKDEDGTIVPVRINIYKATIQRSMDLSFSSEGEPQEVSMTFDCVEGDNNDFVEIVEITDDLVVNPVSQ